LLLYPAGLDFIPAFFGCMYSAIIALPVPPPEPRRIRRTLARLRTVAADAAPAVILTTHQILTSTRGFLEDEAPELAALPWVATNLVETALAEGWRPRATSSPEALAYLQYTSGSTSSPKGVMVSHGNALANSESIRRAWGYGPESVAVMWVPNFHDDGLVHGILQPIHSGFRSYLMSPLSVVERPVRWLTAIGQVGATHSGGPNFAYTLCARRISAEERAGLDLSSWRVAYNAAEPIQAGTLDLFCRTFADNGFRREAFFPAFGLAEATLLVTTKTGQEPALLAVCTEPLERAGRAVPATGGQPARTLVGCGAVVPGTEVVIAHPESGTECSRGEVGEIWIHGPGVAQGYWSHPEATAETFGAHLAGSEAGPFLRTGDLGFLHGGELYVTGRLKDLIIIHGRNHYPQDIELTVERSSPLLRPGCGAAFPLEVGGEERLAVVHEVEGGADLDIVALAEKVCRDVSEAHELQVHTLVLIQPKTLPKTSSGKVQRQACRADLLADRLKEVGRWRLGSPAASPPLPIPAAPAFVPATVAEPTARAMEVVAWLRSWSGGRVNSRLMDERRSIPASVVLDLGNRGLFGLQMDTGLGGLALTHAGAARVLAQLGAIDLTLGCLITGHNSLGLRPLVRWASPAAREELLPSLVRGRAFAAFALTEPGAGSNPRALASRAVPTTGGGWRLQGSKMWIGSAAWARVIHTFAQVPASPGQPGGITGFLVRQGDPGLRLGSEALTMGLRGMAQSEVFLADVPVAEADLLGPVGGGMEVAEDTIALSRFFLGAVALGGIRRCAQMVTRFASRRTIATGRLLDHPVVRVRLGEMTAAAAAVEALLDLVAATMDAGRAVPREVSAGLKTAAAELLWQAADQCVQLLGGRGYMETNLAPQILRDARIFRIFEGPTEALYQFVGSSVLHGGGELTAFLRGLPDGGRTAARLAEVAGELRERVPARLGADPVAALRWTHHLAGELTTSALLLAALEEVVRRSPSPALRRAAQWALLRFEEQAHRALAGGPEEAVLLGPAAVDLLAGDLAVAIGDVEQALAGEEIGVDPLLRAPAPEISPEIIPRTVAEISPEPSPATPMNQGRGAQEIRPWITCWLCTEIGLAPDAVDPTKPFSFLGLDSITGVRMAADLEDWLGRPVDRTAAWDFPTIEALVRHLGGEPGPAPAEPVAGPAGISEDPELLALLSSIESLSPEEAQRELEEDRQRLRKEAGHV
jgi:acyl-CoA synthetase (AMP-forming)/AMP-acid ligase II/alkylation response protein AidB-like acyl-CoA dehydrogenase/acyl carrier protein